MQRSPKPVVQLPTKSVERGASKPVEQTVATPELPATKPVRHTPIKSVERPPTKTVDPTPITCVEDPPARPIEQTPTSPVEPPAKKPAEEPTPRSPDPVRTKPVQRTSPATIISSPSRIVTSPIQKTEIDPTPIPKSSVKVDPDNDSPTPRKKFGTPNSKEATLVDTPLKPESTKQTSPPTTQTSEPVKGISLLKYTKSESIVNAFNPGLATLLSKGPPASSRPMPVKSNSAPELTTTADDIDSGKQLTHLTKGRARGPKKRSSVKGAEEKSETRKPVPPSPPPKPAIMEETEPSPPVPPKDIKRSMTREEPVSVSPIQPFPTKRPLSLDKPVPAPPIQPVATKRQIIKNEPDSPPPPKSSIWNKPPIKDRPVITTSVDKSFEATFMSTPEIFSRPSTTGTAPQERQTISSPSGSLKQRFADFSSLRRDSIPRSLFGNLLSSPIQSPKAKLPAIELVPSSITNKIPDKERLFVQAWSIVSRVKHVSLPNTEEHVLYSKDMHAFLYMFNTEPGDSEPSAIKFLWVGKDCTLGEKEGMEFIRLMGDQNADTQVIQQGHETPLFFRALGGIIVTREGTRRPLNSVEDGVFCVRPYLSGIAIDQVSFRKEEFCSGFSYVVKRDGDVFVWHGNGSLSEEIAAARRFAAEVGQQVREMMEADPSGCMELWKCFDDHEYASGEFWRRKYDVNGFSPMLYIIEGQKV